MTEKDDLGPGPFSQLALRLLPKGAELATFRQERWERATRRAQALAEAVSESISMVDLLEAMQSDERLEQMFQNAVEAAASATSADKIKLLGRVLAAGASAGDDAKVDEAGALMRLATELDPVELRALMALDDAWNTSDFDRRMERSDAAMGPARYLAKRLGLSAVAAGPIESRLLRLGLLANKSNAAVTDPQQERIDDTIEVEMEWWLTETTDALLELLRSDGIGS